MERERATLRALESNRARLSHILGQRQTLLPRIGTGEVRLHSSPDATIKVGVAKRMVTKSISRVETRISEIDTEIKTEKLHEIGDLVEQGFLTAEDLEIARRQLFPGPLSATISLEVAADKKTQEKKDKPEDKSRVLPVISGKGQELLELLQRRNDLTADEIVRLLSLKDRKALNTLIYSTKPRLVGTGLELITPGKGHTREIYSLRENNGGTRIQPAAKRTEKKPDNGPMVQRRAPEYTPTRPADSEKKLVIMGDVVRDGTRMIRLTLPEQLALWEIVHGGWEKGLRLVLKDQSADLSQVVEALNRKLSPVTGTTQTIKAEGRKNGVLYTFDGVKFERREGFLPPKPERIRALGLLFGEYRGSMAVDVENLLRVLAISDRRSAFETVEKALTQVVKRSETGIATDDEFRIYRIINQFMHRHNLGDLIQLINFLSSRFFRSTYRPQPQAV